VTFPTPFTVGHHVYSSTTKDGYNREIPVYTPTRDAPGVSNPVYGWANPVNSEPKVAGHDRVVVEMELYAPPAFHPGPQDLIDIPGSGQFEVIGYPEDYNHGPFGFQPGYVINLRRVEG
jgi:hypothetical protein